MRERERNEEESQSKHDDESNKAVAQCGCQVDNVANCSINSL